jgi:hypothetical protein
MVRRPPRTKKKSPPIKTNLSRTRKITKTGRSGQCQCIQTCTNPSLPGQHFCKYHMSKCPRSSPLSGFEPVYDPHMWNKTRALRETHNCFSYAMNINDPKQTQKCMDDSEECEAPFHQPGSPAGYEHFSSKKIKTCPNMVARILGDNPDISMTTFESRCPVNTSKIALIVDPKEDYHFLRQDSNMLWSHKAGAQPVKNIDAGGSTIWGPQLAFMNFKMNNSMLNYSVFCAYLCVPRAKKLFLLTGGLSFLAKPFRTNSRRGHSSDHR